MNEQREAHSKYGLETPSASLIVFKIIFLFFLVYLFILSITLLGTSFKLFGSEFTKSIFQATSNPMVGLMIGILTTAIIQSSSTTTSIIVLLVAGGTEVSTGGTGLSFEAAIPMVMGANIGTSITNVIVSLGHISRNEEFSRALAGSLLHDFFNVCAVIVILPLQLSFNIIGKSALFLEEIFSEVGGLTFVSPIKVITKPIADSIIDLSGGSGIISAIIAFVFLFIALHFIVKTLKSLVLSKVEVFFQRYIFRTPALSFILGIVITAMVQSSSITTSMVVPLIGAGVLTIYQIFPYYLGANIGTTVTAFLASLVTGNHAAVAVAFAHLMFNIFGIAIFWPLKKIPIYLAELMSRLTLKSKLVPIAYILIMFFIIPGVTIFFFN